MSMEKQEYLICDDEEPLVITITSCKGKHDGAKKPKEKEIEPSSSIEKKSVPAKYKSETKAAAILPVITPRYHGPGCSMEISILEKHAQSCRFKKLENKDRHPFDDRSGSFEYIGRLAFKTCGAKCENDTLTESDLSIETDSRTHKYDQNDYNVATVAHTNTPEPDTKNVTIVEPKTSMSIKEEKTASNNSFQEKESSQSNPKTQNSFHNQNSQNNQNNQNKTIEQEPVKVKESPIHHPNTEPRKAGGAVFHVDNCILEHPMRKQAEVFQKLMRRKRTLDALSKYSTNFMKNDLCVNNVSIRHNTVPLKSINKDFFAIPISQKKSVSLCKTVCQDLCLLQKLKMDNLRRIENQRNSFTSTDTFRTADKLSQCSSTIIKPTSKISRLKNHIQLKRRFSKMFACVKVQYYD